MQSFESKNFKVGDVIESKSKYTKCSFHNMNVTNSIKETIFEECDFVSVQFSNSIENCIFNTKCMFDNIRFSNMTISATTIENCEFRKLIGDNIEIVKSSITNTLFRRGILKGVIDESKISDCEGYLPKYIDSNSV